MNLGSSTALLIVGAVFLYLGAEWLVRAAAGIAARLRVPSLVVGLTVVAYGTSMPELVVGIRAGLTGRGGIAFGNVMGSNAANLGLILGLATLVSPPRVSGDLRRRELPMLLATALLVPLLLVDDVVSRIEGGLLLAAALAYTAVMVRGARGVPVASLETIADDARSAALAPAEALSTSKLAGLALVGLAVLLGGGEAFVEGASGLARRLGMSERLVGLTIVAIGTSFPELATSLIAARRGHSDLAIGNVIGSNIFNVLLILGATAVASPLPMGLRASVTEIAFVCGTTAAAAFFFRRERTMARWEGGILLALYVAFLVAVAV